MLTALFGFSTVSSSRPHKPVFLQHTALKSPDPWWGATVIQTRNKTLASPTLNRNAICDAVPTVMHLSRVSRNGLYLINGTVMRTHGKHVVLQQSLPNAAVMAILQPWHQACVRPQRFIVCVPNFSLTLRAENNTVVLIPHSGNVPIDVKHKYWRVQLCKPSAVLKTSIFSVLKCLACS